MLTTRDTEKFIIKQLSLICKEPENAFSIDTQLVGENRSIKSIQIKINPFEAFFTKIH